MSFVNKIEAQYLDERTNWKEGHRLRVHRAISWLKASEKYATSDVDFAFLATVNSANACWAVNRFKDRESIENLVKELQGSESLKKIESLMKSKEGNEWIIMLIGNNYLYPEYSNYLRGELSEDAWKRKAKTNIGYAKLAFEQRRYDKVLDICLKQCVSQRAQVAHGYSTYGSSANRRPLQLTTTVLSKIVGQILLEMIRSPEKDWGNVPYLVKDEKYRTAFKNA